MRQIFSGTTRSPTLMLFLAVLPGALIFLMFNRGRIIAVTNDAMYVLACGQFAWSKPKRVLRVLPRATRFGPVSGMWAKIKVDPERLWIGDNAGAYAEIAAADAEAATYSVSTASVAVFRAGTPSAGAAIVFDGSGLLLAGLAGQPLELTRVCEYDQAGFLEWASEEWRRWVWQHATQPITPADAAAPKG